MSGDSIQLPFGLDMSPEPVRADQPNAITPLLDLLPPPSGLPSSHTSAMVLDLENFNGMPAAEITNRGTSLDPAQVAGQSESWAMFKRSIGTATSSFSARVKEAGSDGFSGAFPDAVATYHQSFLADNLALAESIASPVDRLDTFSDALNTVKSRISLVAFVDYAPTILATVSLARPNPQLSAIMESAYSPSVLTAGSQIAAFPGPRDIGSSGGGPDAGAGALARSGADGPVSAPAISGGGTAPGAAGTGPSGGDAGSIANGQNVADGWATGQESNGQSASGPGSGGRGTNDAPISQAGLSADSAQSAGNTNPGGRGAASPAASGPGLGGAAGIPLAGPIAGGPAGNSAGGSAGRAGGLGPGGRGGTLGSVGSGGGQGGQSGQSGQGGSGSPGGAKSGVPRGAVPGEGGAGNNAMAGRRGITNNMMGGGAGGRGRGEEDDAYTPAEFLTTLDNGDKLIGPLPRVVHPVIGAWRE